MNRHVIDDLYQISTSIESTSGWHEAVCVYVLLNNGCPLLFDAGSHLYRGQIIAELKTILGNTSPKYIFLTHTELPHTGNLSTILKTFPSTKIVVSSATLPYSELPWWVSEDQILYGHVGKKEIYDHREITFLDGILKDQPGTHWMFDEKTQTLFTGDAFGYLYPKSAEMQFDDELKEGIPTDWLRRYHEKAFQFLPLVYGNKVNADLDKVFTKREVKVIAPTHGSAIRHDVKQCVERLKQAILEISS